MKKTYYIEFYQQGYPQAIIKVEAENYEEAEIKAMRTFIGQTMEITELTSDQVKAEYLDTGIIPVDENGEEVDGYNANDEYFFIEEFKDWINFD